LLWVTSSCTLLNHLIPGPGTVVFNDGNGTISVDFSDIEFYPVEGFPLLTSTETTNSSGLKTPSNTWERNVLNNLVDAVNFDQVFEFGLGRVIRAEDLPRLSSSVGHQRLKHYAVSSLGAGKLVQKKFTTFGVEGDFGNNDIRHYALVRVQNRFNFGRKIIRFAFWQSMSDGASGRGPRHIWISDAGMWRGVTLRPIGRVLTPGGWAIMWTL